MPNKPACMMRPNEILAARDTSGCAFVPVSPCFEWHSYHLPLGVDGLIAEGICRHMAARVSGIYFRCLSFGLDGELSPKNLARFGFDESKKIVGMQFPALPIFTEYARPAETRGAIENRLEAIRETGFRHAFIVNNHGGAGQHPLLEQLAPELSTDELAVHYVSTSRLVTLGHEQLRIGGHAGQSETLMLMAFFPELVDFSQLPEGELDSQTVGIWTDTRIIPAEHHPAKIDPDLPPKIRDNMIENFETIIRENGPEAA